MRTKLIVTGLAALTLAFTGLVSNSARASVFVSVNRDDVNATPSEAEEATTYVFTNSITSGTDGASPTDRVPSNSFTDLAEGITPVLLLGTPHGLSDSIGVLTNGSGGTDNGTTGKYFFDDATTEGRIRITLASASDIGQINTYTWAGSSRAPQKYDVYAAGALSGNAAAAVGTDAINILSNYTLIASVDTTPVGNVAGDVTLHDRGQWGVSISDDVSGSLGTYQNFIFRIFNSDAAIEAANEFYSEIDVVAGPVPEPTSLALVSVAGLLAMRRRR